jgi:SAM-dependent methyltransferase
MTAGTSGLSRTARDWTENAWSREAPGWALRLYDKSALKRDKMREIERAIGSVTPDLGGRLCLDLGSDNGVLSLLLRRKGGTWFSADLTETTVASIRALVGDRVSHFDGARLPFDTHSFDLVVVADMMEHIRDDAGFAAELGRVLKPGGALIVNTPHAATTILRRIRLALGQTDEKHGHVRPGYTRTTLEETLGPKFEIRSARTYCRFFSEAIDTVMQWALERLGKTSSAKGVVITGDDLKKHEKTFRLYSTIFPFVWAWTRLDALLPFSAGYRLIVVATSRAEEGIGT